MQDSRDRKLSLNISPIVFDDSEIPVGLQPYDDQQLRALRSKHIGSHLVRRYKDQIVDIPLIPGASPLGASKKFRLSENLGVVASLI
jgi:hypothetical protein